jgi:hypothetical protein
VANSLKFSCKGRVGFIDWLGPWFDALQTKQNNSPPYGEKEKYTRGRNPAPTNQHSLANRFRVGVIKDSVIPADLTPHAVEDKGARQ